MCSARGTIAEAPIRILIKGYRFPIRFRNSVARIKKERVQWMYGYTAITACGRLGKTQDRDAIKKPRKLINATLIKGLPLIRSCGYARDCRA